MARPQIPTSSSRCRFGGFPEFRNLEEQYSKQTKPCHLEGTGHLAAVPAGHPAITFPPSLRLCSSICFILSASLVPLALSSQLAGAPLGRRGTFKSDERNALRAHTPSPGCVLMTFFPCFSNSAAFLPGFSHSSQHNRQPLLFLSVTIFKCLVISSAFPAGLGISRHLCD